MDQVSKAITQTLWQDYDDHAEFPHQTPLLAHYTSIHNFECIMKSGEVWFANPLTMNDSDELLFGMNQGAAEFRKSDTLIKACGNEEVFARLLEIFDHHLNHFDKNHVLDTYILCFSHHSEDDYDGSLSMWRGYGANGNGIAFVIDTGELEPDEDSPIILSPINYSSTEERLTWIKEKIDELAIILEQSEKSDKVLNSLAWHWIERLKVFSLFTKHKGFMEEKEWRFVYLSDRDTEAKYASMFGYNITDKGVEPRLKLKIGQIPSTHPPLSLNNLIDRVIIGPTAASELSIRSVSRMLEIKDMADLVEKVYASSIPYRP